MKRIARFILALALLVSLGAAPASAARIFSVEGTSAKGVDVSFEAELTILGGDLTVILRNTSLVASENPDDLLGSFYFDIFNGVERAPLVYSGAQGDVWQGNRSGPDIDVSDPADLIATDPGDGTWQFKPMSDAAAPFLGFGIGTVGNNTLAPNAFDGNIVGNGRLNYAIYAGDITTRNLDGLLLVKDTATFTFTGLAGFSEADIVNRAAFGLGTAPDSTIEAAVPIPGAVWLLGSGLMGLVAIRRKKRG